MKTVEIGLWTVNIDPEKTREFYKTHHPITEDCRCRYCENYSLAAASFPEHVRMHFDRLGIDPQKEGEVFVGDDDGKDMLLYMGFYHAVGELVEGPKQAVAEESGLRFHFSEQTDLVPEGFPEPVLQWEFELEVPWLLEKEKRDTDE
ncbi:hypothetical protein BN1080_00236 [Planococcus massiliensis]|uniref:Uncharacterized protein n=1 Tax=Planococcus massiliensis TaxID=1499687 RepID=A0A098EGA0_9BACL|nr:hypothetical protein [Planococcus massiliensis]CEG21329.1 hypothetical protein BN1080_00236 [Planococcus massiliensis]